MKQKGLPVRQTGLAPILIVVLMAVLTVGGYLIYKLPRNVVAPPTPQTTPVLSPTPSPANGTAETANWKTYRNAKYKYSVDYPNTFQVIEAKIGDPTKKCCATVLLKNELQKVTFNEELGESTIIVYSNPRNLTLEQWTYEHYLFTRVDGEEVDQRTGNSNLDGKLAKTALLFEFDRHRKTITTLYNGNFYEIIFDEINPNDQKLDEHKKIYNQILSTFRFFP